MEIKLSRSHILWLNWWKLEEPENEIKKTSEQESSSIPAPEFTQWITMGQVSIDSSYYRVWFSPTYGFMIIVFADLSFIDWHERKVSAIKYLWKHTHQTMISIYLYRDKENNTVKEKNDLQPEVQKTKLV